MTDHDSPQFEPEADPETAAFSPREESPPHSQPLPGPGLLESIGWTISAWILHLMGGALAGFVIVFLFLSEHQWAGEKLQELLNNPERLEDYVQTKPTILLGLEMSTFVLGVVILTLARLGRDCVRAIPLNLPSGWHVALTLLWVLPLSLVCSQIGVAATQVWDQVKQAIPSLEQLDGMNTMEVIGDVIAGMPAWQVYLWIAVAPAIGEELLFRVLIGRGLVARYGVVGGIILTTCCFAAVHFHPVHMIALIPLSIAIHISYLASRTIWIPMLAHYLNNAWAVSVILSSQEVEPEPIAVEALGEQYFPWWLTLSALLVSVSIGVVYWKSRVRLMGPSAAGDSQPHERFLSADRRNLEAGQRYGAIVPSRRALTALIVTLVFFGVSMAVHATNTLAAAP